MNSTKSLAPTGSLFSSPHDAPQFDASLQEEQIKQMLKFAPQFDAYRELAFKDMLEARFKANCAGSAFNLVNKPTYGRPIGSQLHSSMLSDEAFPEDLSDHSPVDEECMSDEQMSDDEQPLDFSIKSKKDDHQTKSAFSAGSATDQVDGDLARLSGLSGHSSKYHHSAMFNSLTHQSDYDAMKFFALNSSKLSAGQPASTGSFPNRFPFMNPLLIGESQANLIHSEPSSPEGEGLSSASSTSSRSSSQGYYSSSSLSGANTFNLPTALSQSIAPSIYSPSLFQQSPLNKSPSYMQTAPPSYASLNFTSSSSSSSASSKPAFARNSNGQCQQSRPSVIVSNSKTPASSRSSALFPGASKKDEPIEACSEKIVDSIDEHFRLSLGSDYKKINSHSTPTKKEASKSPLAKKQTAGKFGENWSQSLVSKFEV